MKPSTVVIEIRSDEVDYPMWTTYTPVRNSLNEALDEAVAFMRETILETAVAEYGSRPELVRLRRRLADIAGSERDS